MATFSERLKELRISKGLSQAELAKQLGLSKGAINNYEHSAREPNFEMLETIADFFNVDMDFLLGKTNKTTKIILKTPTYIIGKNGEREVRYSNEAIEKDNDTLLAEMGVKRTNYIVNKKNEKTELSDNEYNFVINSLKLFRKNK